MLFLTLAHTRLLSLQVTIVAKGRSGGHTAYLPSKDSYHETRSQALAHMDALMGGRVSEEIVFGKEKVTGGASSDLSRATQVRMRVFVLSKTLVDKKNFFPEKQA